MQGLENVDFKALYTERNKECDILKRENRGLRRMIEKIIEDDPQMIIDIALMNEQKF